MADRYPPVEPLDCGRLEVGDGHQMYWETVGAPHGIPAVYLHGGPGSGCTTDARRNFGPTTYRAVLFDQRGSGRSQPLASDPAADLSANTTAHLIGDIETLRDHLGVERWVVVGASWGVTLGLAYAQAHPDRVRGMVLGAVTSGTPGEIEWITRAMGRVFPREWERFAALVPEAAEQGNIASAYARLLAAPDPAVRERAAQAWCQWEDTHVSLAPGWAPTSRYDDAEFRMRFARLVTHYWGHDCFLTDGQILAGMPRIAHIPGVLIHGRLDVSSPLGTAWALRRAWPASRLVVLDDSGHGGADMTGAMIDALDDLALSGAGD